MRQGARTATCAVYRVGDGGLRVVHADGSETRHPAGSIVKITCWPAKLNGKVTPIRRRDGSYETQDLTPEGR